MSDFPKCWPVLKQHEGTRYTNIPGDPGEATKFGITLRTAKAARGIDFDIDNDGDIDTEDIRLMDEGTAYLFYRQWWDRYEYVRIIDQQVATKVMDMSINMGPRGVSSKTGAVFGAHVMVQKAINRCGYALLLDGKVGPYTYAALNDCEARELLREVCFLQNEFYRNWCDGFTKVPGDREKFRLGLLNRAAWPFVRDGYLV